MSLFHGVSRSSTRGSALLARGGSLNSDERGNGRSSPRYKGTKWRKRWREEKLAHLTLQPGQRVSASCRTTIRLSPMAFDLFRVAEERLLEIPADLFSVSAWLEKFTRDR